MLCSEVSQLHTCKRRISFNFASAVAAATAAGAASIILATLMLRSTVEEGFLVALTGSDFLGSDGVFRAGLYLLRALPEIYIIFRSVYRYFYMYQYIVGRQSSPTAGLLRIMAAVCAVSAVGTALMAAFALIGGFAGAKMVRLLLRDFVFNIFVGQSVAALFYKRLESKRVWQLVMVALIVISFANISARFQADAKTAWAEIAILFLINLVLLLTNMRLAGKYRQTSGKI